MIFCCFAVTIRENNKYAFEPQSLVSSHKSREDKTIYFDFVVEQNKLELSLMRKLSLRNILVGYY